MDTMLIIWLAAIIGFTLLEALTVQMICIWFASGALAALISALLGVPEWLQIALFIICAGLLLIFTRPIVKRLTKKGKISTNADRAIGMTALVIEEINNDVPHGIVKVNNQTWSARSVSGSVIPAGKHVRVRAIEGVKLMVEEAQEIQKKSEEAVQCH